MVFRHFKLTIAALCGLFGVAIAMPAWAQTAVMKECGDKWQKAKAAKKTGGQTWPQFLSKCRSGKSAKASDTKKAKSSKSGNKAKAAASDKPKRTRATRTAGSTRATKRGPKGLIFPARVNSKYKDFKPGLQRNKTCADQYNANKAKGSGNGGLKYIAKGGYWPLCNAALKK